MAAAASADAAAAAVVAAPARSAASGQTSTLCAAAAGCRPRHCRPVPPQPAVCSTSPSKPAIATGRPSTSKEFQNSTSVFVLFSFSNCVTARLLDDRGLSWRGGSPCGPPASSASSGSPLRAGRRGGNPRRGGGGIGHYSKESIPNWDGRRGGEDRGTNPPTRLAILTSARAFWSCWSALATTSFGASKNSLHLGRSGREDKPQ